MSNQQMYEKLAALSAKLALDKASGKRGAADFTHIYPDSAGFVRYQTVQNGETVSSQGLTVDAALARSIERVNQGLPMSTGQIEFCMSVLALQPN